MKDFHTWLTVAVLAKPLRAVALILVALLAVAFPGAAPHALRLCGLSLNSPEHSQSLDP